MEDASGGFNAKGMENRVVTSDARRTVDRLRMASRLLEANALLTAMTAGTLTSARRHDLFGEEHAGSGEFSCGQRADDFRRIWDECPDRPSHPGLDKSEHFVEMAKEG